MSQYQVGELKSIAKLVRVNADDSKAVIVKNLGNGRRIPLIWATQVTMTSGTSEITVASGVSFSSFSASTAKYEVTPTFTVTSGVTFDTTLVGTLYVEKDVTNNTVKVKSTATAAQDTILDIIVYFAENATYDYNASNMLWKSSGSNRAG
jgi:hypothetical protein